MPHRAEAAGVAGIAPSAAVAELLQPTDFAAIAGWPEDDHDAAFHAFIAGAAHFAGAEPKTRALAVSGQAMRQIALEAAGTTGRDSRADRQHARTFFERRFRPYRVNTPGFVTGYYEPEVAASRIRTARFQVPLYRRPPDLVEVSDADRPAGWDPEIRFARRTATGLVPYFDRREIENGVLAGMGLELAWLEDPVDAFFIHVQGSARLRLAEGGVMRVSYAAKSGHPYTAIARLAVERGILPLERADKAGLESWLRNNRTAGRALMQENRSFIFFRETELADEEGPIGAAGVPLIAGRSLAVDRTLHTFGTPVWVSVPGLPSPDKGGRPFRRLMIAHDTGSAIVGPARGDIFFGSGDAAGAKAGVVRHPAEMVVLVPRSGTE